MKQITIEDVQVIATEIAPKVLNSLKFQEGSFQAEDVVSEYIIKFIEKNYIERYNPEQRSLKNYVYQGLKNQAISMIRKIKKEFILYGNVISSEEAFENLKLNQKGQHNLFGTEEKINETFLVNEISHKVGVWKFGHGIVVEVNGKKYESTSHSILELIMDGFSRSYLAQIFKVSEPTIGVVLSKIKERGLIVSDIKG